MKRQRKFISKARRFVNALLLFFTAVFIINCFLAYITIPETNISDGVFLVIIMLPSLINLTESLLFYSKSLEFFIVIYYIDFKLKKLFKLPRKLVMRVLLLGFLVLCQFATISFKCIFFNNFNRKM